MSKPCVDHHYACDCGEETFGKIRGRCLDLESRLDIAIRALSDIGGADYADDCESPRNYANELIDDAAMALEKINEDHPPERYLEWHPWAEKQYAAGERQTQCDVCKRWLFPKEQRFHKHEKGE